MRASSLPLLTKCTGSLILPCDHTKSDNAQDAADWGTMVHFWAQTGKIKGPSRRAENALIKAIKLSGVDRESLWPSGGVHEGSLSIRVDGVREASRDDTERSGWITGHYDYQWWLLEGELWIDDLKTGKYYPNPDVGQQGWVPRLNFGENRFPQDVGSVQLKTYGLCLAKLLAHTGVTNVSLTHWPRLPLLYRHAPPTRVWTSYTSADLENFWTELEAMYQTKLHNERALLGHEDTLILNPGDHCRFCPARAECFVAKTDFSRSNE